MSCSRLPRRSSETILVLMLTMRRLLTAIFFLLLGFAATANAANMDDERYDSFPLIDQYVVLRTTDATSHDRYVLTEDTTEVITDLKALAADHHEVIGTCDKRYFIAAHGSPPRYFDRESDWTDARRADGISDAVVLRSPEAIAATIKDTVLRPYRYQFMKDGFGWSDDTWGAVIEFVVLIFVFVRGVFAGPKAMLTTEAVLLGLGVDVVAGMILEGGGGPALLGLFVYPAIYSIAAKVGELCGKGIRRFRARPIPSKNVTQPETPPA